MTVYTPALDTASPTKQALRRLKRASKPPVDLVQKQLLKIISLYASKRSNYAFSHKDINLYAAERFAQMQPMRVEPTADSSLVMVTIGEKQIYWPSVVPTGHLPWLFHEIFDDFEQNPSSYNYSKLSFSSRDWVMDAGAAEGYFSLFALEQSAKKVLCVEPLSVMRKALEKTLETYAHSSETVMVSAALGREPGMMEMEIDYDSICDAFVQPTAGSIKSNSAQLKVDEVEQVSITTIDRLAEANQLGDRGLIKMDIEGFEMEALKGASTLLKDHKPALAIAVYHDLENANECAEIIKLANPSYDIEFRGFYGYFNPPRPYMLFAT